MRFPIEILTALRRVLGRHHVLGIRLSGDELVDGGLNLEDTKLIAARLCDLGLVDYINTSIANFFNLYMVMGSMQVPLGYNSYSAAGLKEVVNVPVFASGRINSPTQAERIISNGQADLVCIARGLICDPHFAKVAFYNQLLEMTNNNKYEEYIKEARDDQGFGGLSSGYTSVHCMQSRVCCPYRT